MHKGHRRVGAVPLADLLGPLPPAERAQLASLLRQAGHLLAWCVTAGGRELARIEPTTRGADHQAGDVPVRLSRFAFCRSRGNVLVLESALTGFRAVLSHKMARELVAELGAARAASDLAGDGTRSPRSPSFSTTWSAPVWSKQACRTAGSAPTKTQRCVSGTSTTCCSTPGAGPAVPLHRPSMDELLARDPALTVAIEGRRSVRDCDEQPMTAEHLGEFLYRVARVRGHHVPSADGGEEAVARPYPSGGSAYDLELHLSVRRCAGLTEGIYCYDPVAHRLVLVNEDSASR